MAAPELWECRRRKIRSEKPERKYDNRFHRSIVFNGMRLVKPRVAGVDIEQRQR
jgi:hypothetical protein